MSDQTPIMPFTWAVSKLHTYEGCPHQYKLRYVDKLPPPDVAPTTKEPANERGQRLHTSCQTFIEDAAAVASSLPTELAPIMPALEKLKQYALRNKVSTEERWSFTRQWLPTSWKSADEWGRAILDVAIVPSGKRGLVIDYKTGKYMFNESKHYDQALLYAIVMFMRQPQLETIRCEFWYIDHGKMAFWDFGRDLALRLRAEYERRVNAMQFDTKFKAKPDAKFGCKYCDYRPVCEFAL